MKRKAVKHTCMDCIGPDAWTRASNQVMGYACERCGVMTKELRRGHCDICYEDGYRSTQE